MKNRLMLSTMTAAISLAALAGAAGAAGASQSVLRPSSDDADLASNAAAAGVDRVAEAAPLLVAEDGSDILPVAPDAAIRPAAAEASERARTAEPAALEYDGLDSFNDVAAAVAQGVAGPAQPVSFNPDRLISDRADPVDFVLDFDADSGNVFALIQWPDGWSIHRTANGAFWSQTYFWNAGSGGLRDVDMAVVDGWVYVAYVPETPSSSARLRRVSAATGQVDAGYSFKVIDTAPSGAEYLEVDLETNADALDNRLYYTTLDDAGRVVFRFAVAFNADQPDNTTFNARPPLTGAARNLDTHWNQNGGDFLFFSYVDTSDNIRVWSRGSFVWNDRFTGATQDPSPNPTITAHRDTIMVAYEDQNAAGDQFFKRYLVSYDGGANWAFGIADSSPSGFFNPDVSGRLGYGTAIAANQELGAFDPLAVSVRQYYRCCTWNAPLVINNQDLQSGSEVAIQALPLSDPFDQYRFGVLFEADQAVYFDRIEGCPGDANGDRVVNADDLLAVLGNFGVSGSSLDGPFDGDMDRSGSVNADDLLAVLGAFGTGCPI